MVISKIVNARLVIKIISTLTVFLVSVPVYKKVIIDRPGTSGPLCPIITIFSN